MIYDSFVFFFQAEDGIRDLVRSRGLGDVYKRQAYSTQITGQIHLIAIEANDLDRWPICGISRVWMNELRICLLYTSDAADERSSVDLGGRRIIKKKKSYIVHVRQWAKTSTKKKQHYNNQACMRETATIKNVITKTKKHERY